MDIQARDAAKLAEAMDKAKHHEVGGPARAHESGGGSEQLSGRGHLERPRASAGRTVSAPYAV